jgi:hypothetical protein
MDACAGKQPSQMLLPPGARGRYSRDYEKPPFVCATGSNRIKVVTLMSFQVPRPSVARMSFEVSRPVVARR